MEMKEITIGNNFPLVFVGDGYTAVVWIHTDPDLSANPPKMMSEIFFSCDSLNQGDAISELIKGVVFNPVHGWAGARYRNSAELEIFADPYSDPSEIRVTYFGPPGLKVYAPDKRTSEVLSRYRNLRLNAKADILE